MKHILFKVLLLALVVCTMSGMGGCVYVAEDDSAIIIPKSTPDESAALSTPAASPASAPLPTPTPEPVYYKSRVNTLNCRSSADMTSDSNIVCQIGFEEGGEYLGTDGEFTLLRLSDGREVYCYSDYLVEQSVQLYAYLQSETAQKIDITTGEQVFEKDGVTPVMVKNELVDMRLYLPDAVYEQLFATERNITGAPLYSRAVPLMQLGTLKKLMKAYEIFKSDGYTLKVYDAYRPVRVQRILYDIVQNSKWIANPDTTASNHNRGCAIDLSLIIDETGEEIETPTPMHTFTKESARSCKTWSDEAKANVDYITEVMAQCGFNCIESEWWHFSDTDSAVYMTTDIDLGTLTMLPKQEENQQ